MTATRTPGMDTPRAVAAGRLSSPSCTLRNFLILDALVMMEVPVE